MTANCFRHLNRCISRQQFGGRGRRKREELPADGGREVAVAQIGRRGAVVGSILCVGSEELEAAIGRSSRPPSVAKMQ
jgi:hypothetical protein